MVPQVPAEYLPKGREINHYQTQVHMPMLGGDKTKLNSQTWDEERFVDQRVLTKTMEDKGLSQIHLAGWPGA